MEIEWKSNYAAQVRKADGQKTSKGREHADKLSELGQAARWRFVGKVRASVQEARSRALFYTAMLL